jgi:hypothetical protein
MAAVIMIKIEITMIIEAAAALTAGANAAVIMQIAPLTLTLTTTTAAIAVVAEVRVGETRVTRHEQKEKKLTGTYLKLIVEVVYTGFAAASRHTKHSVLQHACGQHALCDCVDMRMHLSANTLLCKRTHSV